MKNLFSRAVATAMLLLLASVPRAGAQSRERDRFDDGWKFHLLDDSLGEPPGTAPSGIPVAKWRWHELTNPSDAGADAARPDFNDADWPQIASAYNAIQTEKTSAWFRAVLPPAPGPHPVMHFDSVDDRATVYLNGQKLAEQPVVNDPFDVPLDPAWNANGPNVLAVLVENVGGPGGIDGAALRAENPPPPELSPAGPSATAFDDGSWRPVHLPHDFIIEGTYDRHAEASHGFLPNGAGWYRKHFSLPARDQGKTLWLEFDGVYRDSVVWLNGVRLGRHASGYTSFYYDISKAAHYGGDNVVAVWADARRDEGWWYEGGGIYRHVYLTKLNPMHVAHWGEYVVATPSADFKTAEVTIETDVVNDGPSAASPTVAVRLLGADPRAVTGVDTDTQQVEVAPGGQMKVAQKFTVPEPKLWSPETPYLYTVQTTLSDGNEMLDRVETPIGIRSLRWDKDAGFFLNGQPYKIQGTCNHQDFAGLGVALPDDVHYYKVERLKEMGSNAFRFSHQPMAPELLDACDRLGMLVMDENRKLSDSPEILGQVESLVRRDRNHPSVFLWSMCNEEGGLQGNERGARMFTAAKNTVLQWDRTRPVTCAMNGGFFGPGISLVEDLQGFNYNTEAYDHFHQDFPRQPGYGSETASETTTRGVYQDDREKCYVSVYRDIHEKAWQPLAESGWLAGGFVWTGFDYRGEPSPYRWPDVLSHYGIMDLCGFPKDSYYYYQGQWSHAPVAHILPHWTWPGREGQEIDVHVDGNAAKYDLLLNGQSLGLKEMPSHSHIDWRVKYAPGVLETRGYDAAGHQIVAAKEETTGAPARLRLIPDRVHFVNDGEDVVIVRCAVLDAQDRVIPTAANEVTFTTEGPAQVAGVGNGNPSDLAPDKASKRDAFNGFCLAVVQSTGDSEGAVTVSASSPGLTGAKIDLRVGGE